MPTISRLCKEACGTSFSERITAMRLQKAKELLLHSKLSIPEIAAAVGYASDYSFRRAFLRQEEYKIQEWLASHTEVQCVETAEVVSNEYTQTE